MGGRAYVMSVVVVVPTSRMRQCRKHDKAFMTANLCKACIGWRCVANRGKFARSNKVLHLRTKLRNPPLCVQLSGG